MGKKSIAWKLEIAGTWRVGSEWASFQVILYIVFIVHNMNVMFMLALSSVLFLLNIFSLQLFKRRNVATAEEEAEEEVMSDGGFHEAQMNNMEMTSVSVETGLLFIETERVCHAVT